jgi:hypothetical protein
MIIGIGVMLFSAVLLGAAIHHVMVTGTCSSTGYNRWGPTAVCPKSTGLWIAMLMVGLFVTPVAGAVGGAGASGILTAVFGAIGIGACTVALDDAARSGNRTFALIFGALFTLVALASALLMLGRVRSALRGHAGVDAGASLGEGSPILSAASIALADPDPGRRPASSTGDPVPPAPSAPGSADALDRIAKLADLHDRGALTDAEFAREKARLLADV